jgi:SAM-dependent methyltransferase
MCDNQDCRHEVTVSLNRMNTAKPIRSFIKARFPRAAAAYRDARLAWTKPSLTTVFSEIYHTNAWQDGESMSGRGSTLARTTAIMAQLPLLLQDLNVKTLLDAGCGDFNWMNHVSLAGINYIGIDVVPELMARNRRLYAKERRTFAVMDITRDRLPAADAILCRECFIHLSLRNIQAALGNFKKTGATHLLCTTHPAVNANTDCPDGGWRSLNLQLPPFDFPEPVRLLVEDEELRKCLGVWRLKGL